MDDEFYRDVEHLHGLLSIFNKNKKPKFTLARELWLYCVENDLKIPSNVWDCFYQKIKEDHESYGTPVVKQQSSKGRAKMRKAFLRSDITSHLEKHTVTETCEILAEKYDKSTVAIKQEIHRMREKEK